MLALLFAVSLVAAACGDDDDDSASDTTETTVAEESADEGTEDGAAEDGAAEATIVETAVEAGDFTTLVSAVEAAGLDETLSGGEWTVFAPTDAAFQPLVDDGTVDSLLQDPEGQLTDILTYHVVEGAVFAEDVAALDGQEVETVQGATLTVSVSDAGDVTLTDGQGNTVNVVTTDIEASNGVIHVIDGVLLPPTE